MLAALSRDDGRRLTGAMATDRASARAAAGARASLPAAQPPRRRHRLGDLAPWRRSMPQEYGWDIQLRGAGRGDRGAVHQGIRRFARALLDRRSRRRAGRLGLPGEASRRGRQAAPAAGGEEGARARRRAARWSSNASASRARKAIARSRCGPRASWSPRAASISAQASSAWPKRSITVLAVDLVGETWELDL